MWTRDNGNNNTGWYSVKYEALLRQAAQQADPSSRNAILAQAVIVRAPLTLLLPNGARVDNQNSRYLAAFPEARNLTGGKFDLTTVDSAIGPFRRDAYFNRLKSVVAEATLAEGLAVQLRYGHDARVNQSLNPSSTSVFAPGATGNLSGRLIVQLKIQDSRRAMNDTR